MNIPKNPQNRQGSRHKTPLHLRLTCEDWLETFNQLNRAELGVLYYIRCLDPYGDRELDVDSGKLAALLGIHRSTVSRALMSLKKKNLVSMEIAKAKVSSKAKNLKATLLCMDAHHVHGRTSVSADAQHPSADAQHPSADAQHPSADAQPPIYKDRVRDQTTKTKEDSKDTLQDASASACESEGVCVPVSVEILDPEPELAKQETVTPQLGANEQLEDSEQKPNSVCPEQSKNPDGAKSSAAPCDNTVYVDTSAQAQEQARGQRSRERLQRDIQNNQDKVDELIGKFEMGEITQFPRRELRLVAGALIGEYVELYRESGDVCCSRPNDIDSSFAAYVEKRLGVKIRDRANAISRIRNCEQSPTRWRELVEMVEGWQATVARTAPSPTQAGMNAFLALSSPYR